jgi:hypothetical protein
MFSEGGRQILLTAENPQGPWSDPAETGWDTADPSLFLMKITFTCLVAAGPPINPKASI